MATNINREFVVMNPHHTSGKAGWKFLPDGTFYWFQPPEGDRDESWYRSRTGRWEVKDGLVYSSDYATSLNAVSRDEIQRAYREAKVLDLIEEE